MKALWEQELEYIITPYMEEVVQTFAVEPLPHFNMHCYNNTTANDSMYNFLFEKDITGMSENSIRKTLSEYLCKVIADWELKDKNNAPAKITMDVFDGIPTKGLYKITVSILQAAGFKV